MIGLCYVPLLVVPFSYIRIIYVIIGHRLKELTLDNPMVSLFGVKFANFLIRGYKGSHFQHKSFFFIINWACFK